MFDVVNGQDSDRSRQIGDYFLQRIQGRIVAGGQDKHSGRRTAALDHPLADDRSGVLAGDKRPVWKSGQKRRRLSVGVAVVNKSRCRVDSLLPGAKLIPWCLAWASSPNARSCPSACHHYARQTMTSPVRFTSRLRRRNGQRTSRSFTAADRQSDGWLRSACSMVLTTTAVRVACSALARAARCSPRMSRNRA